MRLTFDTRNTSNNSRLASILSSLILIFFCGNALALPDPTEVGPYKVGYMMIANVPQPNGKSTNVSIW